MKEAECAVCLLIPCGFLGRGNQTYWEFSGCILPCSIEHRASQFFPTPSNRCPSMVLFGASLHVGVGLGEKIRLGTGPSVTSITPPPPHII